jgi:hypothetical protein
MTAAYEARANGVRPKGGDNSSSVIILVIAVLYGAILSQLPTEDYFDHANYLAYAENSWDLLVATWTVNPLVSLVNEPLWLLLNAGLAPVMSPGAMVQLIIFVSATTVALKVMRFDPKLAMLLFLFLLMPQVIQNYLIHLRQGVAIAIFLTGWFSERPRARWVVMALAPFVHSSFIFIFLLLGLVAIARRLRLGPDFRVIAFAGPGIAVGLGVGWLAALFGARQADEYSFVTEAVSGIGFLLWLIVFLLMYAEGRSYLRRHMFEGCLVLFYLGAYFFTEITSRVFESGILLVLLAAVRLTGSRRSAALLVIGAAGLLQWVGRLNQPLLGFGIT